MLVLVDGLNLFHALKTQNTKQQDLDIMQLAKVVADSHGCDEVEVIYFTSIVEHLSSENRNWQIRYVEKLKLSGVKVSLGEFRSRASECSVCGSKHWIYQEKQTDVPLAAELIKQAFTDSPTEILLFSADTDFLPAVKMVSTFLPEMKVRIVSTVSYLRPIHGTLVRASSGAIRLSPELVAKFQFKNPLP